jgi:hypothetical protein
MRRSSRIWRRKRSRVKPVIASSLSNATGIRAALEGVDPDRHLDGIRLRGLEALDFGEDERPLDQPIDGKRHGVRRAGAAARRGETAVPR